MRAIILLALLGTAFAVPRHIQKIIGGTPSEIQKYPFLINMQYGWWGLFWDQACGGALLTSTTILSAAHCYYGDDPDDWRVRVGTSFASSGGNVHYVSALTLHPNYNHNTLVNDIAIVRLSSPAQYSANVQPCRVAGPTYILPDNTNVINIGWGSLQSGGNYPEQMQEVTVQKINHALCVERYAALATLPGMGYIPPVTSGMLCSGILDVGGKDACQGDSGGPLIHSEDIVIGVVSWGYECAHPEYPGVNADVAFFSDWIAENGAS